MSDSRPHLWHNYYVDMVGFGGGDRMGVMTLQPPLPLVAAGAVEIGAVAALVEDDQGGRVYVRGELAFVWDVGDEVGRRLAAVQLMRTAAATGVAIAAGFGIERETLRRWMRALEDAGTAGLIPDRRGPKGPSKVTEDVLTRIRVLREQGASLRSIASQVGVSTRTVRRSLTTDSTPAEEPLVRPEVLAEPVPRSAERGLARQGLLTHAPPVFTPAARCRWQVSCWLFPAWRPPDCWSVHTACTPGCRMGSTAWTRCCWKGCSAPWQADPEPKAPHDSRLLIWVEYSVWTGHRRSRRSAGRSINSPPRGRRVRCWPG